MTDRIVFIKFNLLRIMKLNYSCLFILLFIFNIINAQEKKSYKVNTVAFYNLENLYDTENDESINDESSPIMELGEGLRDDVYKRKLINMARVLSEIGSDVAKNAPAIIGLCEVENRRVLEDLVNQKTLEEFDYGIIQFDSPDRRGIDVALLYQKSLFQPISFNKYELFLYNDNDITKRVFTRDQLLVSGLLDGEKMSFIINHWPSRSGGESKSRPKRIKAAKLNKKIIDSLLSDDPYSKIITMGDLNDDPTSPSVKDILKTKSNREDVKLKELYNPMEEMHRRGLGTLAYSDGWNLFDQIILTSELLKKDYNSYRFYKAGIYNKNYLVNPQGRYKGYPYRSYADGGFTGGFSDHFPVYVYLIKEVSMEK